jgi:hypothetical protein
MNEHKTDLPLGYLMRPPTLEDVPSCLALIARCAEALGAPERYAPQELIAEWEAPNATLDHNIRVVESGGEIVAYGEAWDTQTPPVNIWTWMRVDPTHEGRGLGTALNGLGRNGGTWRT